MAGRAEIDIFEYSGRLKAAIGYRSRKQSELARAIGISNNSISRMTRGETLDPGAQVLRAIAIELNVSMDYLMGLIDTMERKALVTEQ